MELASPDSLLTDVESLKAMLIARATGGASDEEAYAALRRRLIRDARLKDRLPKFLFSNRNLLEFWGFIQPKFASYRERREFLRKEFDAVLSFLEGRSHSPADDAAKLALEKIDSEHVADAWRKALDRKSTDPEGAITAARTLLESISKHVLDESGVEYADEADLPRLYRKASEALKLAPSQHTEEIFKQILGGCAAVVEGLGALRNRLSDAHGKGVRAVKPSTRHAELAVNLAGAVSTFLITTHESRVAKR